MVLWIGRWDRESKTAPERACAVAQLSVSLVAGMARLDDRGEDWRRWSDPGVRYWIDGHSD
jgi:hypothetical protein